MKVRSIKFFKPISSNARKRGHINKYDPTRTFTLRRSFCAKINSHFALLKADVRKLILDQNAFGLTANISVLVNDVRETAKSADLVGVDKRDTELGLHILSQHPNVPRPQGLREKGKFRGGPFVKHPFPYDNSLVTRVKVKTAINTTSSRAETIPLDSLVPLQSIVRRNSIKYMIEHYTNAELGLKEDKKPVVVRIDGKNYLYDGTHRSTADYFSGLKHVKVKMYGEEATKQPNTNTDTDRGCTNRLQSSGYIQDIKGRRASGIAVANKEEDKDLKEGKDLEGNKYYVDEDNWQYYPTINAWSDAAREAALLARRAGAKAGHLEHVAKTYIGDKVHQTIAKLPAPLQKAAHVSLAIGGAGSKATFASWTTGQALAERVAIERGSTPEQAKRLRGVLSSLDMATFKPISIGMHFSGVHGATAGVVSMVPPASAAYLAYSTVRNPLATYRAAKGLIQERIQGASKAIKGKLGFNEEYEQILMILNADDDEQQNGKDNKKPNKDEIDQHMPKARLLARALEAHKYDDWYIALLHAAMEETDDVHQALMIAARVYKKQGKSPVDDKGSETADVIHNSLSLSENAGGYAFHTDPDKVAAFKRWIAVTVGRHIKSKEKEELWNRYIQQGYQKGAGRAFDDARKDDKLKADLEKRQNYYEGSRDEFLKSSFSQPVSVEKVKLLAGRTFDDLDNITKDMSTKMTRSLTDALVQGKSPREAARDISAAVDMGRDRALLIARTELIRAHAEGQLDALKKMGVQKVGAQVEFSTTGDGNVCEECEDLEGETYTIDEARGIIPVHPRCRCAWIPYVED